MIHKIDYQLDDFLNYCKEKNLSLKTIASYEQTLRLFIRYLYDTYKIVDAKDVKEDMIRNYIRYLQERGKYTITADERTKMINFPDNREDYGKKISVATINNYLRNIKVFFNFLVEFREIRNNPTKKNKSIKTGKKVS
ncbi:hypothetical protein O163_08265 [Caldanaerobacter subterraneus subsp. yonseiensis KB-1]|uniref:Core-binding (CB) domain-containing protein n=1 Tax=Caldanaerobacter subterraneus subsp. yonseiensis KB-1 TaxID=1388761 RepID=U5CV36_CALSX|nr:site-specific integrase [Caldanaerobacter subterraneus]ERM91932.1 hypothetical protein O163_08265 [Caldanaerobacter subterraneus subsp. yonseiensis KB-1]